MAEEISQLPDEKQNLATERSSLDMPFWLTLGQLDNYFDTPTVTQEVEQWRTAGSYLRFSLLPNYDHTVDFTGAPGYRGTPGNIQWITRTSTFWEWMFSQVKDTPHNYELAVVGSLETGMYSGGAVGGNPSQDWEYNIKGFYELGTVVNITARTPNTGEVFIGWTVIAGTVYEHTTTSPSNNTGTFGDASALSTTFTMPYNDVVITANYQ